MKISPIINFNNYSSNKKTQKSALKSSVFLPVNPNRKQIETVFSGKQKLSLQAIKEKIDVELIKRDASREYEILADKTAKKMEKMGYTFEKPRLVFQKISDKDTRANYSVDFNTITVDPYFQPQEKTRSAKRKLITLIPCYLTHELQHAMNAQITLHAEGVKEACLDRLQKLNPDIPKEKYEEADLFCFRFEPKRTISLDEAIPYCNLEFCISDKYKDEINPAKVRRVSPDSYIPLFTPREMFDFVFVGRKLTEEEYWSSINEILAYCTEINMLQKIALLEDDNRFDRYITYLSKKIAYYLFEYLKK